MIRTLVRRVARAGTGDGDGGRGAAVPLAMAARELAEGARRLPGVQGVRVRPAGTAARPRLAMTVVCAEEADLAALYTALEKGPADRCRSMTKMSDLPVTVRFKVVYRQSPTFPQTGA
ncbi:hypothetical protein SAMN04489712_102417 [Thermomonospora echinospora]|uniref:Uncharacterized protein n=1 Tax=Thermomonospora echinospora TaxID=1992 RepID=A0A1H5VQE1_9ACTN|nr:hypothetical protein [Thermomonospora echinospora]SEF89522.1 hypothetical protein SAMN04489712_102417 [Thermomonospora echinospora]